MNRAALLVAILWVGSAVVTSVPGFRLGYSWKTTELQGRHAVGNVETRDVWDIEEALADDEVPEPLIRRPEWREQWSWDEDEPEPNDDTEEIPTIQDVSSPVE